MQQLKTNLDGTSPEVTELEQPPNLQTYIDNAVAESANGFLVVLGQGFGEHDPEKPALPLIQLVATSGNLVTQSIL